MNLNPLTLFEYLTPGDESPNKIRTWRGRVAFILTLLLLAVGGMPVLLETRYAVADEETAEHQKIRTEIAGIKGSVDQLVMSDTERQAREKEQQIREIRQAIYNSTKEACGASAEVRALLLAQANDLRTEYMALTSEEFPELPCTAF